MKKLFALALALAILFVAAKVAEQVDPAGYSRFSHSLSMFMLGAGVMGVPIAIVSWLVGAAHERGQLATQMLQQGSARREPETSPSLAQEAALLYYLRNGYAPPQSGGYSQAQIPSRVVQRPAQHTVTVIGGD